MGPRLKPLRLRRNRMARKERNEMIVRKIKAKNFVTYENLSLTLPTRGIIGIEGRNLDKPVLDTNAVGKTLILDMVSYALYGEVLRKKAANIIGPFGKNTLLEVMFYSPRLGGEFTISRKRTGSAETVTVNVGDKTFSGRPRNMQPKIDQIIGVEWLTFQNCILYGDSRETNFVYVADSKRKEILAQIAGILHLREARKLIGPDLKDAENSLSRIEGSVESLMNAKTTAKHRVETDRERLENFEQEQNQEVEATDKEMETIRGKLHDEGPLRESIDKTHEKIKALSAEIEGLGEKISHAEATEPKKRLEKAIREISRTDTIREQIEGDIRKLDESGECPMCATTVDDTVIDRVRRKIPFPPESAIEEEKKARQDLKTLEDLRSKYNEKLEERSGLKDRVKSLEYKLKENEAVLQDLEHLDHKKKSLSRLREEIQKSLDKAQEDLEAVSEELVQVMFNKQGAVTNRDVLKFWNEQFSPKGAEGDLIVDLIKKLQSYSNQYIHKLTDGSISIYIEPEKETTKGTVKTEITIDVIENDEIKDFDLYSGGQRNRIEKAIRLGLMMVSGDDMRFKLFDEIGKDLSVKGYEEIVKLMREIFDGQQILLVTNDRESKKLFDHRILVMLQDGRSKVKCSWGEDDG